MMQFPSIIGEVAFKEGYATPFALFIITVIAFGIALTLIKRNIYIPKIRRLAAIDALDEAIGRATEMGRPVHYCLGLGDLVSGYDVPQTIASLSILQYVARKCAEYDTPLIVTFRWPGLQMIATEVVRQAYLEAGKPEKFKPENIIWVTSRQFAFASGVMGIIQRERVAASMLLGYFAAESLLIAESGNLVGAIQIAGTANSYQIPFFVAACDYTLISEELMTAGAYISGDPHQVGTVFSQDILRVISLAILLLGAILLSFGMNIIVDIIKM
ncbi:MAG: hypothetical protein NDF55_00370 [archaeon GB-1867-005]|nr:hypothetical protein [Candidatus Culexmicrobium cathedralense]